MEYQLTRERLIKIAEAEEKGKFLRSGEILIGDEINGLDHTGLAYQLRSKHEGAELDDAGLYCGTNFLEITGYTIVRLAGYSPSLEIGEEGSPQRQETGRLAEELLEGSNVQVIA